jgi:hypothetical protein
LIVSAALLFANNKSLRYFGKRGESFVVTHLLLLSDKIQSFLFCHNETTLIKFQKLKIKIFLFVFIIDLSWLKHRILFDIYKQSKQQLQRSLKKKMINKHDVKVQIEPVQPLSVSNRDYKEVNNLTIFVMKY